MEKCFVVHSSSLGDTICSTPTLKKLSESYGAKFHVATHVPEVFFNNPCVEKIINIDSVNKENYEIFETFRGIGEKDKSGVEKKHNTIDIRQFHAMDLGFGLLPEEMECKFYPDIYEDLRLPSDYICIHPTQTWESRTWAEEKWQELVNELIRMGVCVVLVGKDSQEFGFWDIEKPTFDIEGGAKVINLLNQTNLSSTWNVINNASCFITMDSGLLHLAGTTDTHIIQLGSSINYKLRAPYRKGSQDYKYNYIGGTCDIFCGSDMKYGIKEWGTIHGVPPIIECLENKPTYECHPSVDQVINQLSKNNIKIFQNRTVERKKRKILYIAPHLSTGGSPEWLRKAIESIKDDFEVFVVEFSFYADKFTVQRKKIIEIVGEDKFYSLGSVFDDKEAHVKNRWKLIDIINEIQPDVVHINEMPEMFEYNGFPDEILDELYKENRSYQIYETSHCSTYKPDEQKRYIPDGFIHCSSLHFKQYKNFDVPQYLAEYPVEKKERPNRKKILEGLNLDPSKKHVLQVGLFTHLKNQKYTFELARATQNLNIQYHFVGNACWKEGCGIPDEHVSLPNCKLWGERNDVDVFMSCMDVLIFPSLTELNPIVLKEADSWDMNIFLNDIPAYGETFKDNKNVTFMTLDLKKDKEVLNWCEFYSSKCQKNSWLRFSWEEIIRDRIYEKEFKIEENDIVMDIGANLGFFAASCSQKNINRCYCFEPVKEIFKNLQKNINNLIDCNKFELINKAVGINPEIYISAETDESTPFLVEEKAEGCLALEAIKLSSFLEEKKIEKIDFLKMDIEGMEWLILNDDDELNAILNKTKKFIAELHFVVGNGKTDKRLDFNINFIKKFQNSGFEIKIRSLGDGVDITNKIINNHYLTDVKKKAYDYYEQFYFYAWKK